MYTNIDTDHAIEVISEWLDNLATQIYAKHPNFPSIDAVKEAMVLVMRNNIFECGVICTLFTITGYSYGYISSLYVGNNLLLCTRM